MIKVALPNKGQLLEPTLELLSSCGYRLQRTVRSLCVVDAENDVEFYFLRPGDIPLYVANGILDAGITGKDFVAEKEVSAVCLRDLDYGRSRLCAAVPNASSVQTTADLRSLKIATSFPHITRKILGADRIVELEGAVEISIKLGIAEAIVDVVETGSTLREAGLRIVGVPLFLSSAALYAHPTRESKRELVTLQSRIVGRLLAKEYVLVEYDAPTGILAEACRITPGIESPTIMSLEKAGWSSVRSMIRRREAQRILDELSALGCKGILLTAVESVRI